MMPNTTIVRATAKDSHEVAEMAGELLREIMDAIGVQAFNFDLGETTDRLMDFLNRVIKGAVLELFIGQFHYRSPAPLMASRSSSRLRLISKNSSSGLA
jgi:GTP cyclohydrolase I